MSKELYSEGLNHLSTILLKAQGRPDAETNSDIDIGYECMRLRAVLDGMNVHHKLPQDVEGLKHERNVLQKICAQRADALEKIGLRSDCTLDEVDDWMAGHVRVPVEMIRRAIYAIEHFAYDTVAGRNSAHELHELLSAAKEKGK